MPKSAFRTLCGLAPAGGTVGVFAHLGPRRWLALTEEQEHSLVTWPEDSNGGPGRVLARYVTVHGMRVPSRGDVGWHLAGRWQPVWEGTVTDLHYEFTP